MSLSTSTSVSRVPQVARLETRVQEVELGASHAQTQLHSELDDRDELATRAQDQSRHLEERLAQHQAQVSRSVTPRVINSRSHRQCVSYCVSFIFSLPAIWINNCYDIHGTFHHIMK